jgi:lipopolysaccharide assembly protein A
VSAEPQPSTQKPSPVADDPRLDAPPPGPQSPPQPGPQQPGPQQPPHHTIKHTRISGLWVAVGIFAVVLLFLLIFILQNGRGVDISYLGAHGHMPLGVALLLAAVCGALLVILAAAARMAQLRSTARKHRRTDAKLSAKG